MLNVLGRKIYNTNIQYKENAKSVLSFDDFLNKVLN